MLSTLFNNGPSPVTTPVASPANPAERRAALEQVVREHAALRETVSQAEGAFESHDKLLRSRYLNPTGTPIASAGDDAGENRCHLLRQALGDAQRTLAEYETEHDIPAVQAELADIRANGDARERDAARRKLIELMADFERDILQYGTERWEEILRLGNEIERKWPGQRMTCDLPCMPPGIFEKNGLRSIPTWFRETLCAAAPESFPADDPVRVKIEKMRAERSMRIWSPLPPEWRL